MKLFRLVRTDLQPDGTLGKIVNDKGQRLCNTLELPWLGNRRSVSCIPAGTYTAHRRFSPKHGYDVFELQGVPDRDHIEIHIGNYVSGPQVDSEGCILVGLSHTTRPNGAPMLAASKTGFALFMKVLDGVDEFLLSVEDPQPIAA